MNDENIPTTQTKKIISTSNWVIAFLTLVNLIIFGYSVLKPFDKENIIAGGANELFIQQVWGNLNFYQYFHLRNSGQKQGIITSFDGLIVSKDNPNFKRYFSAKYYQNKLNNNYYPIVSLVLNPNDYMDCYFQMLKDASKEDRDSVAYFLNKKSNEIDVLVNNAQFYDFKPKEVSSETFNSIKNYSTKGYKDFKEGEYQYIITLKKDNERQPFYVKCYSFVIYRSDLNILDEGIKNYAKDGGSPVLNRLRNDQIVVQLTEIQDQQTINRLENTLQLTK